MVHEVKKISLILYESAFILLVAGYAFMQSGGKFPGGLGGAAVGVGIFAAFFAFGMWMHRNWKKLVK